MPQIFVFVKLYYHAIPQLNPEVAKKIIDREKAKAMEPHLKEMIHAKLIDDGKIEKLMAEDGFQDDCEMDPYENSSPAQVLDYLKNA